MVMKDEMDALAQAVANEALVAELYRVRREKAALEKREEQIKDQLKPQVDPFFDKMTEDAKEKEEEVELSILFGAYSLIRDKQTRSNISADLLLSQGVEAIKIAKATKVSSFYTYKIKEVRKG